LDCPYCKSRLVKKGNFLECTRCPYNILDKGGKSEGEGPAYDGEDGWVTIDRKAGSAEKETDDDASIVISTPTGTRRMTVDEFKENYGESVLKIGAAIPLFVFATIFLTIFFPFAGMGLMMLTPFIIIALVLTIFSKVGMMTGGRER